MVNEPNGINENKKNAFEESAPLEMNMVVYDEKTSESHVAANIGELKKYINPDKVNLIFINNLTDAASIEELGMLFGIHPMVMEDALSESELPTVQESGDQLLLTLKLLKIRSGTTLIKNHIGILLGEYYVIVFKDSVTNVFAEIRDRIHNGKSKARQKKSDYLFYLLTDTVIDTYYQVVNDIDDNIDKLESIILERPNGNYIRNIYMLKQPISEMRGALYPIREALMNLVQGDYPLIEDETIPFLHDVKDHVNNIVSMFESSRDTMSDLLEINNSNINNRLNHTMKILTVITTLFVPLTLIAGIYGMNFKNMPELNWKYGYPFALLIMIITASILWYIIRKNKLL